LAGFEVNGLKKRVFDANRPVVIIRHACRSYDVYGAAMFLMAPVMVLMKAVAILMGRLMFFMEKRAILMFLMGASIHNREPQRRVPAF
jgi:hypothetical protein